jgi:Homeodomain-like domain
MRPSSVYAKHACPAGDSCDLLRLLQGPHRVGYRLIMVLRCQQDWSATRIAELLGCDPRTVRRWVQRTTSRAPAGWLIDPASGGPGWAAGGWGPGSAGCWSNPKPGRSRCCTGTWAVPP